MPWERRRYRGNKVWILVDEAGRPDLDDRGHAQLRYKPEDDRTYTVRPGEIRPLDAAPEDAPPASTRPPIEAWIHVAEPTPEGEVRVGILLCWRERRRELVARLPAASEDEIAVGAVLAALDAIRKPEWPVRVRIAAGARLDAIRGGAGTSPPECGEALRGTASGFADLDLLPTPTPAPREAERAARLACEGEAR